MNLKNPNMLQSTMKCDWEVVPQQDGTTKYICTAKGVAFRISEDNEVIFSDIPNKVLTTVVDGPKLEDYVKNAVEGSAVQLMAEAFHLDVVKEIQEQMEADAIAAEAEEMDADEEVDDTEEEADESDEA